MVKADYTHNRTNQCLWGGKTQSNNLQVARKAAPLLYISVTPLSLQQKLLDCEVDLERNVWFANGFAGSIAGYNCGYWVAFVYLKQKEKIFVFKHFIWQWFALYHWLLLMHCCATLKSPWTSHYPKRPINTAHPATSGSNSSYWILAKCSTSVKRPWSWAMTWLLYLQRAY